MTALPAIVLNGRLEAPAQSLGRVSIPGCRRDRIVRKGSRNIVMIMGQLIAIGILALGVLVVLSLLAATPLR